MNNVENWPNGRERSHVLEQFKFENGQQLDKLELRYLTAGTPEKGENGTITNAVLLLHTTNCSGPASRWTWIDSSQLFPT